MEREEKCPVCGKKKIITDEEAGEMFCTSCGFVLKDKMVDQGAEWRKKDAGDDRARTGPKTTLTMFDKGLSTVMSGNVDSSGKKISGRMKGKIERLQIWDNRTKTDGAKSTKNLRQALVEMEKIKKKLGLTDSIMENASYIYRKTVERDMNRGRSIESVVAACVYAACRNSEVPRTIKDIAEGLNLRQKSVAKCYRNLYKKLDLKMPVIDPIKSMTKIASDAGIDEKCKRVAIKILEKAKEEGVMAGKAPIGLVATALYLASQITGGNISQKFISEKAGITEVTIRNRCVELRPISEKISAS